MRRFWEIDDDVVRGQPDGLLVQWVSGRQRLPEVGCQGRDFSFGRQAILDIGKLRVNAAHDTRALSVLLVFGPALWRRFAVRGLRYFRVQPGYKSSGKRKCSLIKAPRDDGLRYLRRSRRGRKDNRFSISPKIELQSAEGTDHRIVRQ